MGEEDEKLKVYKDSVAKIQASFDEVSSILDALCDKQIPTMDEEDLGKDNKLALELGMNILSENFKTLNKQFNSVINLPVYAQRKNEIKKKKWEGSCMNTIEICQRWKTAGKEKA